MNLSPRAAKRLSHHSAKNIKGVRSGKLVALEPVANKGGHINWLAQCDCGKRKVVRGARLVAGEVKSCGCLVGKCAPGHGMHDTPTYRSWQSMLARCRNPKDPSYVRYGGQGITVCERWHDFQSFLDDMGPRPSLKHSIDRIDGTSGYKPGNCRWATWEEQNRNKRDNLRLTYRGLTLTATEWAERLGVDRHVIYNRNRAGWPVERIIETPCRRRSDNVFPR